MESTLKKGALGYKSKEVEAYLIELSAKYKSDIKEKNAQIENLNKTIALLEDKIATYEAERLTVADALVKAQKEAQDIMDAAVSEAEKERTKILGECDEFAKKIEDAKKTLSAMQKDALKVIDDYKDIVAEFTDFKGKGNDD